MSRSSRRWLVPLLLAPVLFAAACNSESSLEAGDDTATSNEVSDTTANDGSRSPVTLGSSTSTDPSSSVQSSVPTSIAGSGSGGTPTTRPRSGGGGGSGSRATTSTAGTGTKSQTIEFPTVSGPWAYGESRALPALATSGLKVTLAASGACQVTNPDLGVLTATDVGECRVTASQSGGSGFTAAPPVSRTVQISKATPRIEGFGDQSVEYLREFFTVPLTATATGGAPVLYRLLGPTGDLAPCALQGNTVEISDFIQDTPTSCFIEAYVEASRQFEAASARAAITITPTFVEFIAQSGPTFDPGRPAPPPWT